MEQIENVYLNFEKGLFNSPKKLYQRMKSEGLDVTMKQVKEFLKTFEISQITKRVRKKKGKQRGLITYKPKDYYQIDILIYDNKAFKGYKYILNCIDLYSRFVTAVPLKSRTAPAILKGLEKIFQKMGDPEHIMSDNEFNKKVYMPFFKTHVKGELLFSDTEDQIKNVYIERFNRTIREMLNKYFIIYQKRDWVSVLPKIIANYNSTIHSTTKKTPIEVFKGTVRSQEVHAVIPGRNTFTIGEFVRIMGKKKTFDKGSETTLSEDVYKVLSRKGKRHKLLNINTGKETTVSEQRLVRNKEPIKRTHPPIKNKALNIGVKKKRVRKALKKLKTVTKEKKATGTRQRKRRDPGPFITEGAPKETTSRPRRKRKPVDKGPFVSG